MNNTKIQRVWSRASCTVLVFLVLIVLPRDLSAQCQGIYSDGDVSGDLSVVVAWNVVWDLWEFNSEGECGQPPPINFTHNCETSVVLWSADQQSVDSDEQESSAEGGGCYAEAMAVLSTIGEWSPGWYGYSVYALLLCTAGGTILEEFGGGQVPVPPKITASPSTNMWYFGGQHPAGYATVISLHSSGGAATTWTLLGTSSTRATLTGNTANPVTGTVVNVEPTTVPSSAPGDIEIRARYDGIDSQIIYLTSRTPHRLMPVGVTTVCDTPTFLLHGYETVVSYDIRDNLDEPLPESVGVSETVGAMNNVYTGHDWPYPTTGGYPTPPSNPKRVTDHLFIHGVPNYFTPRPLCSDPSTYVYWLNQTIRIGSTTSGQGKKVQENLISFFTDQAAHIGIISPVP